MNTMDDKKYTILLLGGTGFVGKALCYQLVEQGHQVIVLSRNPKAHRDLEVLPTLRLIKADIHDERVLIYQCLNVDIVINLVGILNAHDLSGKDFDKVHTELAKKIVNACRLQNVKQLVHVSALGADSRTAPSHYLRSKGKAEETIARAQSPLLNVTIFRPSLIIGCGAAFIKQFRRLLQFSPGVMVLPCAHSLYAPVSLNNVIQAIGHSVMNHACFGRRYNLCGPKVYSLKTLVSLMAQGLNKKCWIISLNTYFSLWCARVLQFFPGKPLTPDNVLSASAISVDSIAADSFPAELAVTPNNIEHILQKAVQSPGQRFSFFDQARKESGS